MKYLFDVKYSGFVFSAIILFFYCIIPFIFYYYNNDIKYIYQLSIISLLSSFSIFFGFIFHFPRHTMKQFVEISIEPLLVAIWTSFALFSIITIVTAQSIPLVSAIQGADSATLAFERENFLKARTGWQSYFVYVNALFCGAIIPATISLMFINRYKFRWVLSIFFLVYCMSFIEKAFFLKLAIPILYLILTRSISTPIGPKTAMLATGALLITVSYFSGAGSDNDFITTSGEFFSQTYAPSGALSHIAWRSLAVPIFTAADSVQVYLDYFNGKLLWGATSSFLAFFSGERIEFERLVFASQWGQNETATGSSNAVYFVEAYINFGYIGVVCFSLFVGQSLRWMANSQNEAFRSLWPLYCFNLYSAGLIGILLSNGFLLVFIFFSLFAPRLKKSNVFFNSNSLRPDLKRISL